MDRYRVILEEERRRMLKHKERVSEELGFDAGVTAIFGWIEENAESFRQWVETVPFECIGCGICRETGCSEECPRPFDEHRLRYWQDHGANNFTGPVTGI